MNAHDLRKREPRTISRSISGRMGRSYTAVMDQVGRTDDDSARAELARTVDQIKELTEWRFALPGGVGDAALRDQVEDLQAKANRLCLELGEPQLYPTMASDKGRHSWLGWAVLAAVVVGVLLLVWVVL